MTTGVDIGESGLALPMEHDKDREYNHGKRSIKRARGTNRPLVSGWIVRADIIDMLPSRTQGAPSIIRQGLANAS